MAFAAEQGAIHVTTHLSEDENLSVYKLLMMVLGWMQKLEREPSSPI